MEPRFNKVAGDQPNLFIKWRVCYIENLDITNMRGTDQNFRYIKVIVNDWFVTQVTSVKILQWQCLWHIKSHWLKDCCLFTIRLKGFVDRWSVQHLPSAACWHCNSLYQGRFTFGLLDYVYYIEKFIISWFVILRFYSIHFTVTLARM